VAEDLAQDVFVSLYQALPSFTYRSRAEFYAFVFTIVRRTLARHYGDKHTKAHYLRADIDGDLIPEERTEAEQSDIERALNTLPPLTREVVILHHWSGYTFAEIGVLLNLTESAARVRHHRALETMRTYFNHS
jgi:RNA polymerase sigma-70 factor (ECF subfamily)